MDVNPYESPSEVQETSLPDPRTPGPIWLEILYLALTAVSFLLLVPAAIVLLILLVVKAWT
jgi:hypothetical protein